MIPLSIRCYCSTRGFPVCIHTLSLMSWFYSEILTYFSFCFPQMWIQNWTSEWSPLFNVSTNSVLPRGKGKKFTSLTKTLSESTSRFKLLSKYPLLTEPVERRRTRLQLMYLCLSGPTLAPNQTWRPRPFGNFIQSFKHNLQCLILSIKYLSGVMAAEPEATPPWTCTSWIYTLNIRKNRRKPPSHVHIPEDAYLKCRTSTCLSLAAWKKSSPLVLFSRGCTKSWMYT